MSADRGIVSTGVYVPRQRLDSEEIESAWDTSPPVSRVAVPVADEDAITMTVAAARDALEDAAVDPSTVRHLAIGTTTPPLEEEALAPRAADALGLDDPRLLSATQSTVAGADVLLAAAETDGPALAVVADTPQSDPDEIGRRLGAGAAAFLFDTDGAIVLDDATTRSRDAPGLRFRERGSDNVAELDITTYERDTTRALVSGAIEALDGDASAANAAVLHQPTPDIPHRIARALPLDGEVIERGSVVDDIGDAGAATPAIGLLAALDACESGDTTIAGFFGSGSTAVALSFESRREIETGVAAALDDGELVSYPDALRERGTLGEPAVAGGGAHVSLPSWQRTLPQRYHLIAGKCPDCDAVSFPPEGACGNCRKRVEFQRFELPSTGEIVAKTVIGQGGAPPEFVSQQHRDGPFAVAIVEIVVEGESVRLPAQLTDCDPQKPAVGDAVTATFRRIYEIEGVTRYGLKFTPE
ncbi:zinc ribbon domain-containing protein [Halococcus sp. AFM35]|uniref:zinc ribbon domain-containing protein n=1 Tax=Halococcus sp. AFM35 TaxID=3421653 RepID=UPI003EB74A6F